MAFKEIIFNGEKLQRLDVYLREILPTFSRRLIQRGISKGKVLVNGRGVAKGYFLKGGERIQIDEDYFKRGRTLRPNPDVPIRIIYKDEWIVAVDKPAPLPTHALDMDEVWTLANGLIHHFPEIADVGEALCPGLVHRLDTGTSGVVIVARNSRAYEDLRGQFRRKEVEKGYMVLVSGNTPAEGTIRGFLGHDPSDRRRMRLFYRIENVRRHHTRWSETRYKVVERFEGFTLLKVRIRTGVMHQIRVHLASMGNPVVGDFIYGSGDDPRIPIKEGRLFLHAQFISFFHPKKRERMVLESTLPDDLKTILDNLRSEI